MSLFFNLVFSDTAKGEEKFSWSTFMKVTRKTSGIIKMVNEGDLSQLSATSNFKRYKKMKTRNPRKGTDRLF